MEITAMCKLPIVSSKGSVLFKKDTEYKGFIHEGKSRSYLIKDSTGSIQELQDDKFFKTHFKVLEIETGQGENK